MRKAVLDTNVLISGLLKRGRSGIPDQILRYIARFQLFLSEEILEETDRVLHYPRIQKKHNLSDEDIHSYIQYLRSIAIIATDLPTVTVAADPDDNIVLACALKAQADYIVSGDPHLKKLKEYQGIQIVPPVEFLKLLEPDAAQP